ncbi:chemotaxis protein CheB [Marilutibacter aestuarii]|uniref:CheB-type methylesterase domain-containing protein n=1 Tax=Marilutibacter aestuarii TaxID=1706195 RepID=A0A508AC30_9GAMM|nr:chemotaxis protein CheB [Lysobacter aestuarii]TQD46111.1 hypothetical protein FKV25_07115 [Lysobacter aestuarii]
MTETARRVALLVRPGVAGDRLRELLAEAGIESVLQGDPTELAAEALAESGPQVVLVALDPETEDALERFDAVLGSPDVDVIYEEAELAAVREGWEQARWKRHLLAKLQGHDRVLPPRPDGSADADPVALQLLSVGDVSDQDLQDFDPELAAADAAPAAAVETAPEAASRDAVFDAGATGGLSLEDRGQEDLTFQDDTGPAEDVAFEIEASEDVGDRGAVLPEADDSGFEITLGDAEGQAASFDSTGLTLEEERAVDPTASEAGGETIELDVADFQFSASSFDPALAEAEEAAGNGDGSGFEITFTLDDEGPSASPRDGDDGLEAHLESLIRASSGDTPSPAAEDGPVDATPVASPQPPPLPPKGSSFGELSLADGDGDYVAPQTRAADDRFGRDLADLDERIASLELVDDSAERGGGIPGAVLVMAGIGGPDAVRQLLGALPNDFPRPVLVQQRLDGGRYDRLVAQMQRATTLPVQLAEPGQHAVAGFVYMLPAGLGIQPAADGMRFVAEGEILAALPAADSAVVLLSGSDPADVDQALKHRAGGALVAGQSAEGCYDASASDQLVARGGESGQPAELALRLAERWLA